MPLGPNGEALSFPVFSSPSVAASFNSTEMLTTVGVTRSTSGARLGIAMSISFWVCRVRFEPLVGPVSPGGWALYNVGRGSERPRPRLSGSIGYARHSFPAIRKQIHDSLKGTRNGGKRFRSKPLFAPMEGGVAINSCRDGSKASPALRTARPFAQN